MGRDHSCEECGGSGLSGLPHEPWCSDYKPPSAAEAFREDAPLSRPALSALSYINEKDAALERAESHRNSTTTPNVVDLGEYRERDLTPRQRLVMQRIREGAECGLCGDLGAIIDPHAPGPNAGQPVPCMACGKRGEQGIIGKPRG